MFPSIGHLLDIDEVNLNIEAYKYKMDVIHMYEFIQESANFGYNFIIGYYGDFCRWSYKIKINQGINDTMPLFSRLYCDQRKLITYDD